MNDAHNAATRQRAFERGASAQPEYDSSSWLHTALLANPKARGLSAFAAPWSFVNGVSATWTILYCVGAVSTREAAMRSFEAAYSLVFTALGFLLVFRLSRAAVRFWECRTCFGNIVIGSRNFVDYLLASAKGREVEAIEDACAWLCAFAVCSKQFLRAQRDVPAEQLAGILSEDDRLRAENARHPPLFCIMMVRRAISRAFGAEKGESVSDAVRGESISRGLNAQVDFLVLNEGALERLRSTKLPMVYVVHLRTFLVGYLLTMPFVFASQWRWGTIPAVAIVSFVLLGIEGSATECEIPFSPDHANHLRMDQYIQAVLLSVGSFLAWDERTDAVASSLTRSHGSCEQLVIEVDKSTLGDERK